MGVSMMTAFAIATRDDIIIDAGGPCKATPEHPEWAGKYCGWITLGPDDYCRPLLNTEPVYETPAAAKSAMCDLVAEIKVAVAKETGGKHPIDFVLDDVAKPGA